MRIASVIGSVHLSVCHPSVTGYRWIVVAPFSQKGLRSGQPDCEELIVLDELGTGMGQMIGISEGGEAAMPFIPEKKPIDAYCSCVLDRLTLSNEEV